MEWKWEFTFEILPRILWATGNTLIAAGVGYAIALVVGLVFLLGQRTGHRWLNAAARECVEFIRSTPLLVQLFFVYYVAPQFGLVLSAWTSAMLTIGVHYGTYLSEVYRGGLEAIPKGQWESARALNLGTGRTYSRIILPQAFPVCLPGMGNYLVAIFKDTPCSPPSAWPSCCTRPTPSAPRPTGTSSRTRWSDSSFSSSPCRRSRR